MKILINEAQLNIINEYSTKLVNTLIDKFQQQNPNLDRNIIKGYIQRFKEIKNNPNIIEKDINRLTWKELETAVDANQPKRIKAGKLNDGSPSSDSNLIYNQKNLRIYAAKSQKACIKYGNGYSFCISTRGDRSLYDDYVFNKGGSPYFIFDDSLTSEQDNNGDFLFPNHLLVLFVHDDYYTVTDANNKGDKTFYNFDDIVQSYPKLKGLKKLFKQFPPNLLEKQLSQLKNEYSKKILDIIERYSKNFGDSEHYDSIVGLLYYFDKISQENEKINQALNHDLLYVKFSLLLNDIENDIDNYEESGIISYYAFKKGYDYTKESNEQKKRFIKYFMDDTSKTKEEILNDFTFTTEIIDVSSVEWFDDFLNDIKKVIDDHNSKRTKIILSHKQNT